MSDHPPTPTALRRMGYPKDDSDLQSVVTPDHSARILDPSMFDTIGFGLPNLENNGSYYPSIESNVPLFDRDETTGNFFFPADLHPEGYNGYPSNVNAISFEEEELYWSAFRSDLPLLSIEASVQSLAENDHHEADSQSNRKVLNGSTVSPSPSPKNKEHRRGGGPKVCRVAQNPKKPRRGIKNNNTNRKAPRPCTKNSNTTPKKPRRGAKNNNPSPEELAMRIYVQPNPNDVLGGRGERIKQNQGNQRLHEEKEPFQRDFWATTKTIVKEGIAERFIGFMKEKYDSRFLDQCPVTGEWYKMDHERRLEKIKQILRTARPN